MRTNIDLNNELLKEAKRYSYARTKRALVEEALQTFVQVKAEQQRSQTYRDRVQKLDARLAGIRLRESPLAILRQDRERP